MGNAVWEDAYTSISQELVESGLVVVHRSRGLVSRREGENQALVRPMEEVAANLVISPMKRSGDSRSFLGTSRGGSTFVNPKILQLGASLFNGSRETNRMRPH
jgi:hypothetical protein